MITATAILAFAASFACLARVNFWIADKYPRMLKAFTAISFLLFLASWVYILERVSK